MSSLQDKKNSKCRFLHCSGSRLYIVDLGLNCVYILSLKDSTSVRKFGTSGKSDGQFRDPAGLVSDSFGNVILADAGNHRLQVFDKSRKFVGNVHIYKGKIFLSGLRGHSTTTWTKFYPSLTPHSHRMDKIRRFTLG